MTKQHTKRIGSRLLDGREGVIETAAYTAGGYVLVEFMLPDFVKHGREAAYDLKHAMTTIEDAVQGGPEGMMAARSLEDSIKQVAAAAATNQDAANVIGRYMEARAGYVREISEAYTANETTVRVAGRLKVQVEAAAKNLLETGNDIKPQPMRDIDVAIAKAYGKVLAATGNKEYQGLTDDQIVVKALEKSTNLERFYTEVRSFYDERQKGEEAVKTFMNYLEQTVKDASTYNAEIEKDYPDLVKMLRQGYGVEDYIIQTDGKLAQITADEVAKTGQKVQDYSGTVQQTRDGVQVYAPIPSQLDWIAIATNPVVVALAIAVGIKGLKATFLPGFISNGVSRAIAAPVKQGLNGVDYAIERYKGGSP